MDHQANFGSSLKAWLYVASALGAAAFIPGGAAAQSAGANTSEYRVENRSGKRATICIDYKNVNECRRIDSGQSHIIDLPTGPANDLVKVQVVHGIFWGSQSGCVGKRLRSAPRLVVRTPDSCAIDPLEDRGPAGEYPVGVGESVFGKWTDNRWYPGTVIGIDRQGRIEVKFLDGDRADLLLPSVVRDGLGAGQFVYVRREGGLLRGQIVERHGNALVVSFGRNQRTAVDMTEVVLNSKPRAELEPTSHGEPRTLVNVCNRSGEELFVAWGVQLGQGVTTRGWDKHANGQCRVKDVTGLVMEELTPEATQLRREQGQPLAGRTFYYAQNIAAFEGNSATARRYAGNRPKGGVNLCVMQLPRVSFRHVWDETLGLTEAQYCTDDYSSRMRFRELTQQLAGFRTGAVYRVTFE